MELTKRPFLFWGCWAVMMSLVGVAAGQGRETGQENPRAAVVNIQELFRNYYKTQKTRDEINVERARIQKEHNETMGRLRSIDERLRQLTARLQRSDLEPRDRAILEREQGMRREERDSLDDARRTTVSARHRELNQKMILRMENLLLEIRDLVARLAEQKGYDLVFDTEGLNSSQVPVLLFAKDATDITPIILKELNKEAPPRP